MTSALRASFRASLADANRLISTRLSVGLLLAIGALAVALFVVSDPLNVVNAVPFSVGAFWAVYTLRIVGWIAIPGCWALGFLYYADTMRLVFVPQYRLTFLNVLRLIGVAVVFLGVVVLTSVSFFVALSRLPWPPPTLYILRQGIFYVLLIYFGTKFAFASFALKDGGVFNAFGRSWMLTTGATFWPTLSVVAVFYVVSSLIGWAVWSLHVLMAPWAWTVLHTAYVYSYTILVAAFIYPFLARWMAYCGAATI